METNANYIIRPHVQQMAELCSQIQNVIANAIDMMDRAYEADDATGCDRQDAFEHMSSVARALGRLRDAVQN